MAIEEKLPNARIDQHPPGEPVANDPLIFFDKRNGITKQFPFKLIQPQAVGLQNFEWVSARKDQLGVPLPYNINDVVTRGGGWYQSLTDNNTETPGVSEAWLSMNRGVTGGFWEPGVYVDAKPWVFSDHNGFTEIYQLVNLTRPYSSTDIVNEISLGDWTPIVGGIFLEIVDTSTDVVTFNMRNQSEKYFKGSVNLDHSTTWIFNNDSNLVSFKFRFIASALVDHTMPNNVLMSDPNYTPATKKWRPLDVGEYEARAFFDNDSYLLQIFGPFSGGANIAPQVFNNVISLIAGVLDGPRQYFDAEGDLENNPPPEAKNILLSGNPAVGGILTLAFDAFSPMGYAQGASDIKWFKRDPDTFATFEIVGETGTTYLVKEEDVNMTIYASFTVSQIANAPANGNPISALYSSNTLTVQGSSITPELNLSLHYDYYMKKGTYDAVNFRLPNSGLKDTALFFTSPAVANRPLYNDVEQSLLFDRSTNLQYLTIPIDGSSSKVGLPSRTIEVVGVFELTDTGSVNNQEYTIWSIILFISYLIEGVNQEVLNQGKATFTQGLSAGTKYKFRLRMVQVNSTIEFTLQINKNVESGAYLINQIISVVTDGLAWSDGQLLHIGAAGNLTRGLNGKIWEMAFLFQEWLDPTKEDELWTRLNSI